jgi:hypothetical protein
MPTKRASPLMIASRPARVRGPTTLLAAQNYAL